MLSKYNITVTVILAFLLTACKKDSQVNEKTNTGISAARKADRDGMIDGEQWTLARLSNSFDAGFNLRDSLRIFGDHPSIEKEGNFTDVTYGIDSPDLYEDGVRMSTISLHFENDILIDARIDFSTYGDLKRPRGK
jgi:hypothetical protein